MKKQIPNKPQKEKQIDGENAGKTIKIKNKKCDKCKQIT